MSAIKEKVTRLVEPLLAGLGLRLWGLEYLPGGRSVLRLYIENEDGGEQSGQAGVERSEQVGVERSGQAGVERSEQVGVERSEQAGVERSEQVGVERSEQAGIERSEQAGVERSEQVGIDECARASRLIGLSLDVEDIIPGSYVLEVSTPGLERLFFSAEQLGKYLGEVVELSLHSPVADHPERKRFTGRLGESAGHDFSLELLVPADLTPENAPPLHFDWNNVKKARLVYAPPEKPGAPKAKEPRRKEK